MKYIVITRTVSENELFKKKLELKGLRVLSFPCITIEPTVLDSSAQRAMRHLDEYAWIIFTSKEGVGCFFRYSEQFSFPKNFKIAVVGPKTAEEVIRFGYPVLFIPSQYTAKNLGLEFPDIQKKKVLLPRSNIASPQFIRALEKKGGIVTEIPIYKTVLKNTNSTELMKSVEKKEVAWITFTSPSTVRGFIKNIQDKDTLKKIKQIPVISIGPVTTKAAKKAGFISIKTDNPHTTEGMIKLFR